MKLDLKTDLNHDDDIIDFVNIPKFTANKKSLFPSELFVYLSELLTKGYLIELIKGVECRIMQAGKPWVKGKLFIKFEFVADEQEPQNTDTNWTRKP